MKGVSVFLFLGVLAEWSSAQFLNNRPYPTYSLEQMPDTDFSCRDKILGGYYADAETQCQMFHVCVKVAGVGVQDFRFLCPNGTAFDQDHQICADWEDVDCDATTLYYSSDNFDLYRIGSGYESKAVKYGEEEEPFSLQRAETGDIRLNREHQTQRINQQKEAFNYRPKSSHQPRNNNNNNYNTNNNNNNNNNNEKDIFKGSSSSNFFNNKNGGKETDDDEDDSANVNANQNEDRFQRRKVTRKQNRRPSYDNQTTEKPERTNGFTNNFAGSSYIPTTARPASTTHNNQRQRQRNRVNPQYNNADNFRQNPRNNEDDGQYKEQPQYSVSTPAPFRQTQQYNNNGNKQHNSNNGAYNPTTASPQPTTRSTENYPSSFPQQPTKFNNNQYSQTKEPENYPSTPFKKNENYPLTSQKQTKETENYPTTSSFNNNNNNNRNTQQQIYNSNYEVTKTKQTENYPSPIAKKPTTPFKQTDNYPTTFAPKTSPFKNSNFGSSQFTTAAPRANPAFTTGNQQSTTNNNKQNSQSTNFNQQYDNTRFTNTQSTFNQPQTNKQTTQYNPSTQQKQTTQFTQYTPTVPRITTPYASSTTQASQPRRSNRYDETQYDDGSYNSRYENDDNQKGRDEEFLKTAHSTNIASSRNEYIQNTKNAGVSTTQKPRPFSVTPNASKATNTYNSGNTNIASKAPSNVSKPPPAAGKESQPKKQKDASYDYAYYDSNAGAEHEYDIGADIEKSEKLKIKKA